MCTAIRFKCLGNFCSWIVFNCVYAKLSDREMQLFKSNRRIMRQTKIKQCKL